MTQRLSTLIKSIEAVSLRKEGADAVATKIMEEVGKSELLFLHELITLSEELTTDQQKRLQTAVQRYFFSDIER